MSADLQRLKSAIQRIAKEDPEIRGLLGEGQNKGGKASSSGLGTSEAEESRLCCDGSTSSSANPGTQERDPNADGASQDGLDSEDPAKLASGYGTLSGVTDCATGEPICFDGAGFVPPDGWDDPQQPPLQEGYVEGYYYSIAIEEDVYRGPTPAAAVEEVKKDRNEYFDYILSVNCTSGTKLDCATTYTLVVTLFGGESCDRCIYHYPCPSGSQEPHCNPTQEDLGETAWPSDGCTNLAIKDSKIIGSKYDPENDGSYSAPRDSIALCDGEGNEIELSPAANGGWKTINSTTDNGYLYNSSGQQIAHIDGNEYSDPSV